MSLEIAKNKFDQTAYIDRNQDLKERLHIDPSFSAWDHFVRFGHLEGRPGASAEVYSLVQQAQGIDPLKSLPPKYMRKRVHGAEDQASYEAVGRMVAMNVFGSLFEAKLPIGGRILDFGVGCGRVIKPLYELAIETHMPEGRTFRWFGCDIDPETIEWSQRFLHPIGQFKVSETAPPLPYPDEYFNFIYSISIFTHLPEDMQFSWLEELSRVSAPGATLFLTFHGPSLIGEIEAHKNQYEANGFYYATGIDKAGLPSFYQSTYHSHEYVRKEWGKYFDVIGIIPKGAAKRQDVAICKKRLDR